MSRTAYTTCDMSLWYSGLVYLVQCLLRHDGQCAVLAWTTAEKRRGLWSEWAIFGQFEYLLALLRTVPCPRTLPLSSRVMRRQCIRASITMP